MLKAQNCIIANAALCEILSIWWRSIFDCAVYRYRNLIGNHMIRLTFWRKIIHAFFRQVLLILEWLLQMLILESQETNRTKILRKLWCATLQIGDEDVKGDEGTFTYPPAFFLPFVFEKSNKNFIEYSTVTFGFGPVALWPTGYRKRAGSILFGACSDIKKWLLGSTLHI